MTDLLHHAVSVLGVTGLAGLWGIKALLGYVAFRRVAQRRSRVRG